MIILDLPNSLYILNLRNTLTIPMDKKLYPSNFLGLTVPFPNIMLLEVMEKVEIDIATHFYDF